MLWFKSEDNDDVNALAITHLIDECGFDLGIGALNVTALVAALGKASTPFSEKGTGASQPFG